MRFVRDVFAAPGAFPADLLHGGVSLQFRLGDRGPQGGDAQDAAAAGDDLVDILEATVDGKLDELPPLQWDPRPAVCVVMASEGYPGKYQTGRPIRGLEQAAAIPDVKVFHAGTTMKGDQVVTNGGRVLGVTGLGATIALAKLQAYTAVKQIRWEGAWGRKDISDKANA